MKILLTNDDGIFAPGIEILAKEIIKEGHDLTIVAPHIENSGKSHAITFKTPLKVEKVFLESLQLKALKVYGTPADCVRAAVHITGEDFDFCFSGINSGYNAATNVLYSGTVSAAIEANLFGIPSMAVSTKFEEGDCKFEQSARFALEIFKKIRNIQGVQVYNLNTPYLDYEQLRGLKVCKVGADVMSRYDIQEEGSAFNMILRGFPKDEGGDVGSDIYYLQKGYATLSPLLYDVTNQDLMSKLKETL